MAPRTKPGATNAQPAKTSDSPATKPQQQAAQAPAQPAQVKPASDPTPAGANTCGKVCPQTSPNPNSNQKKARTKAERDAEIAKYEQERRDALARGDKKAAQEADLKAAQVMDEPKTLGDIGQEAGGILGTVFGARMGKGKGRTNPRNTTASPAPAPASKPTATPAPPPANATPSTANGNDGGFSLGRSRNEKGKCGEWLAKQDLHNEGYTDIIEVQNKSGHGVDVMGRNANGDIKVYEVKTTSGNTAPPLSRDQKEMGGQRYTDSRLGRAAGAKGHYKNSPAAIANGLKARDWLKDAGTKGKTPAYKKYEMFIEDPKEGCIKKKAQEKPWDKPTSSSKPAAPKGGRRK